MWQMVDGEQIKQEEHEMNNVQGWIEEYGSRREMQMYPPETLVRLLKGDYIDGKPLKLDSKAILDVGFGDGRSLEFYAAMGMDVFGTEVDESICKRTRLALNNDSIMLKPGTAVLGRFI